MAASVKSWLGQIHHTDCIEGLGKLPPRAVHLVFADPPFNIGYEYDEYEDCLESEKYLAWSADWITAVHRVLKDNGTFWMAIGDEYAAELKLEAQRVGFHCRNWVIWYYTFGVHCKQKFTRSHAHLFYFVKNPKDFVFNSDDPNIRVPSARQLVYADSRANPKGRMPDDTWILRPQDLVDGFNPDEDTWYFPRVAGTFKERAGFHGCQMPEQLLGRIIRGCSHENDIVLDPFSGSATTLAVAKKLGRRFFGFEISAEYVQSGTRRIESVCVDDKLDGSEEPKVSAPATAAGKTRKKKKTNGSGNQLELFLKNREVHHELAAEAKGILEAFAKSNRGYSVDRVVADPVLNEDFQLECERTSIPGTGTERNRFLFRLRKTGKLKAFGIDTTQRTHIDWNEIGSFIFASEIAWRHVNNKYCSLGLDEIFCDVRLATQFDEIAAKFAPGFRPLDYRWAALKLRKEGSNARRRATLRTPKQLGISELNRRNLKRQKCLPLTDLSLEQISQGPGVYVVGERNQDAIYAGEACNLQNRIKHQFDPSGPLDIWIDRFSSLVVVLHPVDSVSDLRLARQSLLLKWHRPKWNVVEQLAA